MRALLVSLLLVPFLEARAGQIVVQIDATHAIATVDSRYVSFSIDTAEVVGGRWWDGSSGTSGGRGTVPAIPIDLGDARLRALARSLSPAFLRVGGTEADLVAYDMSPTPATAPPPGYSTLLTAARWDELCDFASGAGLDLVFTLNAGPTERDASGRWRPDRARALLEHAAARGQRVPVFELGNEPNAYWLTMGLSHTLFGADYARDYETARALVRTHAPGSRLAGPACAFWPLVGEPLGFIFGVTKPFLRDVTGDVDLVTWHFYPTQSDRTPITLRPATLANMLDPRTLDESARWAKKVVKWRDRWQSGAEVWLGETGPAQCGGQAGLSDTFASSFWWLDQLGLLARAGQRVQVRQTLAGAGYGLLHAADFEPRPDFWASLLWKKLMGEEVLGVDVSGGNGELRAYAQRTAARAGAAPGSVTLLLLNLSRTETQTVALNGVSPAAFSEYVVTAPVALGSTVALNGVPLDLAPGGGLPALDGRPAPARASIDVPPLSYEFLVFVP